MNYSLSKQALRDIDGITRYTVRNFGVAQAEKYLDGLFFLFDVLADNPRIGSAHRADVRWLLCKSHRIYYRIEGSTIHILRVRHAAKRPL